MPIDFDTDVVLPTSEKKPKEKKRGRPPKEKHSDDWRTEMREKWGSRLDASGNRTDYSDGDLLELERLYKNQAAEYNNAMTPRQKAGVIEICTFRLEMNRCIAAGDSAGAKRYSDMINSAMSREAMKAGDVKQLEATRIDSLIVNLENKGAIRKHQIVGRDELAEILLKDHPEYHTSMDIVDAMLFAIINTMKRNNGEAEITSLPLSAQVEDVFGELQKKPTERELRALAETGIVPPKRDVPNVSANGEKECLSSKISKRPTTFFCIKFTYWFCVC